MSKLSKKIKNVKEIIEDSNDPLKQIGNSELLDIKKIKDIYELLGEGDYLFSFELGYVKLKRFTRNRYLEEI